MAHQLARTHTHVSTSFTWHAQGWEGFQGHWCLRIEESLFNISALLLKSFETIIYYYFLAYFLKQRTPNTDLFPSLVLLGIMMWVSLLSATCVETHLGLYLGLLGDMSQTLVCQAWFIQSELVSPKKKKKNVQVLTESSVKASMHKSHLGSLRPQGLSVRAGWPLCSYSGWSWIRGLWVCRISA